MSMSDYIFGAACGFAAGIIVGPGDANAATACGPRDQVIAMLAEDYAETRRGLGLAGRAQVLEVYASETGSWSVIVTDPEGQTCLVGSGQSWVDLREPLPLDDEPA